MSFAFKFASALRQSHAAVKSGYQRCVGICCQRLCARLSTSASEGVPNRYKIYTKTGDGGTSSLFNGERRSKRDAYFCALGAIDELNSHLGLARDLLSAATRDSKQPQSALEEVQLHLYQLQSLLIDLGAAVATPLDRSTAGALARTKFDGNARAQELEAWIDAADARLSPLRTFIVPGGGYAASSSLHVARSVCRRAERDLVALKAEGAVLDSGCLMFINRLSDALFVMARTVSSLLGQEEATYQPCRRNNA